MMAEFEEDGETMQRLYRALRLIRRVEEEIVRIYPSDKIKSPVHLSIGQEAIAIGVCDVLRPDDVVSATYRGHAAYIAKGGDLRAMFAALYGKADGCAGGKAGSMHLIDMNRNILGASAVVGATIPIALGYALAIRRRGEDRIVVAFFGDGATEEGVFHESLNFAALRKLPVLFVCENNQFAIHQPLEKRWATNRLCARVETYGIPAEHIHDSSVESIREQCETAIADMREGGGPAFLECVTYRWREHVGPGEDYDAGFRDRATLDVWRGKDELVHIGANLDDVTRARIEAEIEAQIADAIAFAERSPFPPPSDLHRNVHAG